LAEALNSILKQSHRHLQLIISDNASNDATSSICQALAAQDPRVSYYRQPRDIGGEANFRFVMEQARGDYFMWAAADDTRSEDFVAHNLDFLEQHQEYVVSISPTRFAHRDFDPLLMGDGELAGDVEHRVCDFLKGWHANARIYGLMRRSAIQSFPQYPHPYLGLDWSIVLHLLLQGKAHRNARGWLQLGERGMSRSKNIFRIYRRGPMGWLLPFAQFSRLTWSLARHFNMRSRLRVGCSLARLNLTAFVYQFVLMTR